jgi:serine/threonine protein kinase/WD40 repeat protein
MRSFRLTVYPESGEVQRAELIEGHYSVGSGADDQIQLSGDGIGASHLRLLFAGEKLQVEPAFAGVSVNGYAIEEPVEVEFPASLGLPGVTLELEALVEKEDPQAAALAPTILMPSPFKQSNASADDLEITLPMPAAGPRMPPSRMAKRTPEAVRSEKQDGAGGESSHAANKARGTSEYELIKEIARGGMGQIYSGDDPQLKRQVAIKVSSLSEGGIDPRFAWEAEVLAQLAHPNIVPIYTIGTDGQKRPFYAMKLVKGRTLQAILNDLKKGDPQTAKDFPLARLLTIYRKVCDAMAFAHNLGFLHRDLKPENIMVGEFGEVLVMDWGLAKRIGTAEERSGSTASAAGNPSDMGMTMEGDVMGTPQYMSPEQAKGMVAGLDERSDLYSLGGILYAILTLRPPIDGKSLNEVLTKVKSGQLSTMVALRDGNMKVAEDSLAAMERHVPEALRAVTLKAMALKREQRYPSVEALAADIEAYQNGFATQAEDAGALKLLLLFIKRNKAVSSAVALFLLAAIAFTIRLGIEKERALAQMEKSRRAAAQANMSLAEAAEAASDSEALRKALDAVPEDLRTRDWNYFQSRIDTATFSIEAPKGMTWAGFDDWPSEPERMVALRSDGEVFALNVNTGTLQSLWNFNPSGLKSRQSMSVSRDGQLVALIYGDKPGNACVEVRNLATGERLGGIQEEVRNGYYLSTSNVAVSGNLCLFRGVFGLTPQATLQVWDWREGRPLWAVEGASYAEFGADQKTVLLIDSKGEVQSRELLSGTVVSTGGSVGALNRQYPWNAAATAGWQSFLSPLGNSKRIRKVNPWKDEVEFEVAPHYGNFASAFIPPGNFFASVGRVSPTTGVVEIRESQTGAGARTFPFVTQVLTASHSPKICSKAGALAVRFPNALKIWRLEHAQPRAFMAPNTSWPSRLGSSTHGVALWSAHGNTTLKLINFAEKDPRKQTVSERLILGGFFDLSTTPDGKRCVFGWASKNRVGACRIGTAGLEEIWPIKTTPTDAAYFALHPVDHRIWTGKSVLDFESGRVLVAIKDRRGLAFGDSIAWLASDRVAEIALEGDSVRMALWDAASGQLDTCIEAANAVWLCASPDGLHLAEAGLDKRVRIRSARTLEVEREFRCHESELTGVAWHPTLPLLVTQAGDGVIRVWNLENFEKVEEFITQSHRATTRGQKYLLRIEITADGRELNVYRDLAGFHVFRPESFQGATPAK